MFEREKVFNASKAAGNLSLWIRAVIDTYEALLVVDPKREQLKVAEQNLREAEAILAEKKAALQEVLDFLYKLEQDYQVAKREKEELEAEVNRCKI
jgi:dynein heavy chain